MLKKIIIYIIYIGIIFFNSYPLKFFYLMKKNRHQGRGLLLNSNLINIETFIKFFTQITWQIYFIKIVFTHN